MAHFASSEDCIRIIGQEEAWRASNPGSMALSCYVCVSLACFLPGLVIRIKHDNLYEHISKLDATGWFCPLLVEHKLLALTRIPDGLCSFLSGQSVNVQAGVWLALDYHSSSQPVGHNPSGERLSDT